MSEMSGKSVCVIGAGVAGLVSTKECLASGFEPTCYEKDNDIGGIWNYKESSSQGDPSLYASCVLNTSKTMTCFSDFSFPEEYPNFPHHSYFKKYLNMYAEHFELRNRIKFKHKILNVSKTNDSETTSEWRVTVQNMASGSTSSLIYDFVIVCNGHFYDPFIPDIKGLDSFEGEYIHSHGYKNFKGFEGKRVLVVGLGNSAGDIASELSRHAEHVFMSTRHGTYTVPRALDNGLPFDMVGIRRLYSYLPEAIKRMVFYRQLNSRINHSNYGIAPNHPFTMRDMIVNDELPTRILVGSLNMKPDITQFKAKSVLFEDGSEERIDKVVFATGYEYSIPFLETSTLTIEQRFPYLYKQIVPPGVGPHTLAVVGLVGTNAPVVPLLEMQARYAVRLFGGHITLPPQEQMKSSCERRKQTLEKMFGREIRFNIFVNYMDYMDDLAADVGCSPKTCWYLATNPRLWWKVLAGPVVPAQYRLEGPGKMPQSLRNNHGR
ncbi:hypothetical protein ScPMuIL_014433 [Solemya velum]